MELLVQQGKVLYVGSSNVAAWNIVQACERAAARHFLGLVSEQSVYNLQQRMIELEVIPACREYGLGLLAYSPLAMGMLSGILKRASRGRRTPVYDTLAPDLRASLDAFEALCRDLGERPAHVALAWLLKNPVLTSSHSRAAHRGTVTGSRPALEIDLDDAALARLDEIWPGPGGQAPEAYAW